MPTRPPISGNLLNLLHQIGLNRYTESIINARNNNPNNRQPGTTNTDTFSQKSKKVP